MRIFLFLTLAIPNFLFAQNDRFLNPILPGGHPDPSICRAGNDYYIVNSSFEYFPGLPIHHSTDLVNWKLVGNALSRREQANGVVNLIDVQQNGGIHAPTIRYNNGTFFIIVTNVYSPKDAGKPVDMVNFIITATNPAGPWSQPHVIEGAPGIDPDLLFDDDGKVYFVGTQDTAQINDNGIGEIWVQQLDIEKWKLTGERTAIWRGACGGCCVEGPHMYKQFGKYYLMVAEGGTSYNHAVMIAASDKVTGPFEANPRNPIFTSRHLSKNNWVHSTGHADLLQMQDGKWYMVALGIRNEVDGTTNMGRETFLMPMIWEPAIARWQEVRKGVWEPIEYQWPVIAPETGKVERYTALPLAGNPQHYNNAFADDFDGKELKPEWNFRRVPKPGTYSLQASNGHLRLFVQKDTFKLRGQYSAMGFRQTETNFEYSAKMLFNAVSDRSEAGISLFQQDDNYINFTLQKTKQGYHLKLSVKPNNEAGKIIKEERLPSYKGSIIFKVIALGKSYRYNYSVDGGDTFISFAETPNNLVICKGYIGTYLGMYATSNGLPSVDYADFDWVNYKGHTPIKN